MGFLKVLKGLGQFVCMERCLDELLWKFFVWMRMLCEVKRYLHGVSGLLFEEHNHLLVMSGHLHGG